MPDEFGPTEEGADSAERDSRRRARRTIGLIGVSALVMCIAGVAFLNPSLSFLRRAAALPQSSPSPGNSTVGAKTQYVFLDSEQVWAVESRMGSRYPLPVRIYRSNDGGRIWQHLGDVDDHIYGDAQLHMFTSVYGYLSLDDALMITTDGGVHWTQETLPSSQLSTPPAVDLVRDGHGWAVGSLGTLTIPTPGQRVAGVEPMLLGTDNSGGTWDFLGPLPAGFSAMVFRNAHEGWISTGSGAPHVYVTEDGGKIWHSTAIPAGHGGSPPASATVDVALLPAAGVVVSVTAAGRQASNCTFLCGDLFASFDGGAHWRSIGTPPGRLGFQDSTHWWLLQGKNLYKSDDAGQTWSVSFSPAFPSKSTIVDGQLHVIDSADAWMAADPAPLLTNDGGVTWKAATDFDPSRPQPRDTIFVP